MKERLDRNRPVLTDGEDRAIWQAIDDERKKKGRSRRWLAWPATAGATAIALLLVVSYFGGERETKEAIDRAMTPERHRLFEVIEKSAGTEGEIVGDQPVAVETDVAEPERTEPVTIGKKDSEKMQTAIPEAAAEETKEKRGGRSELAAGRDRTPAESAAESRFAREEVRTSMKKEKSREGNLLEDAVAESDEGVTDVIVAEPATPVRTGTAPRSVKKSIGETARSFLSASGDRAKNGILSGTVTDGETGKPIQWADVMIRGTGIGGISQADGTFQVFNVPPGTYTVMVQIQGYAPKTFEDVKITAGQMTTIHVEMGQSGVKIDAIRIGDDEDRISVGGRVTTRGGQSEEAKRSLNLLRKLGYLSCGTDKDRSRSESPRAKKTEEERWPISVGGTDPVNGAAFDAMFFEHYGVNPFIDPEEDRYATFAVDVDNASYTMARSYLERGELPPKEAVRVEEFVNAFRHDYEPSREDAFAIHLDAADSPFGEGYALLRVGLKGREIESKDRKPAVLTFVIDVSGSMGRGDRLELVKWALYDLLGEMDDRDDVGIVVYGTSARIVLEHTSLRYRETIERAIASLRPEGATNAEAGLVVAYDLADRAFRRNAINRVILCSDGVANVGRTGADDILDRIGDEADRGVAMTAVGFGMGNYNDVLMEQLADKGDGNYYYVDEMKEARRVFVENLTGTLQTIAKEVKIQVEFEEGTVRRYRLIGYENRDVRDEDFRNDAVDAGEIGAGHEVTALFEVKLEKNPESGRLATVRVRHEDPESGEVTEHSRSIGINRIASDMDRADPTFRLDAAVAEFAEILRKSYWARDGDLEAVFRLARDAARDLKERDQADELLDLIDRAERLTKEENGGWRDDDRYRPAWEDENDE